MILHEQSAKLAAVFQRHCANPHDASAEATHVIDEIFESLGACELCFGRGYNIVGDVYDYCDCKRGDQLKKFVEHK